MGITMEDIYTHTYIYTHTGLPRWQSGKESTLEGRRHRFHLWVGKSPWRRKWQPTPVLLPRKSHGQRSLASYSQWGHKELDTIEQLSMHTDTHTHVCVYIYFFEPHFGGGPQILEWVAIPFSRRSSWPRDWTWVSRIVGRCFTVWATREVYTHTAKLWPKRIKTKTVWLIYWAQKLICTQMEKEKISMN